eukprot:CAMPEP_0114546922 /NCGR_PEP_ID=MMETSP0114-20121206/4190_1 /TAXON_ID=31324 /ORGANISM="Goniomonas sp, Strain m" /LENGTH=311 /DNA_ID=CAMNT_0001731445 /DNA_START=42 /DNA_END=973 /DNA_ORIENTATION=-
MAMRDFLFARRFSVMILILVFVLLAITVLALLNDTKQSEGTVLAIVILTLAFAAEARSVYHTMNVCEVDKPVDLKHHFEGLRQTFLLFAGVTIAVWMTSFSVLVHGLDLYIWQSAFNSLDPLSSGVFAGLLGVYGFLFVICMYKTWFHSTSRICDAWHAEEFGGFYYGIGGSSQAVPDEKPPWFQPGSQVPPPGVVPRHPATGRAWEPTTTENTAMYPSMNEVAVYPTPPLPVATGQYGHSPVLRPATPPHDLLHDLANCEEDEPAYPQYPSQVPDYPRQSPDYPTMGYASAHPPPPSPPSNLAVPRSPPP